MFVNPTLPLPGGDRIVQIRTGTSTANRGGASASVRLRRLARRAAIGRPTSAPIATSTRNLIGADGDARPASGGGDHRVRLSHRLRHAAASAACSSTRTNAPARRRSCVLGYDAVADALRARSATSSAGPCSSANEYATVVGVMPEGFAFPVSHDAVDAAPDRRCRPGAARRPRRSPSSAGSRPARRSRRAQAELTTLGTARRRRATATRTSTCEPRVLPYAKMHVTRTASTHG